MNKKWFGIVRWNQDDVIEAAANNGIKLSTDQATAWWKKTRGFLKNGSQKLEMRFYHI